MFIAAGQKKRSATFSSQIGVQGDFAAVALEGEGRWSRICILSSHRNDEGS